MFKMFIRFDNDRLVADGYGSMSDELADIVNDIDSYRLERTVTPDGCTEHMLSTDVFGDESYLIDILEETPWFMKYVMSWITDDNGLISNMIEVEREMGVRCSYVG